MIAGEAVRGAGGFVLVESFFGLSAQQEFDEVVRRDTWEGGHASGTFLDDLGELSGRAAGEVLE